MASTPNTNTTTSNDFLGTTYPYYKNVKNPNEMGMSNKGTMNALSKDVDGLIDYIHILVSGKGNASKTGKPLGNKYFLNTQATCVDTATGQEQPRYIYINNVPSGDIPILSSVSGTNFSAYKGLLPGVISNLNVLNPKGLMNAFSTPSKPECQSITMQTIDNNNKESTGSYYVALADIKLMDPCFFPNGKNPVTKEKCKQGFVSSMQPSNLQQSSNIDFSNNLDFTTLMMFIQNIFQEPQSFQLKEESILTKVYMGGIASLALYAFYQISKKS